MQNNKPDQPPRSKRPRTLAGILVVAGAAFIIAALALFNQPASDLENSAIGSERSWRLASIKAGAALPGTPDLSDLDGRLKAAGLKRGAPIFMRLFKREFELELWIQRGAQYVKFATYPICRWSGHLGPKKQEGDRQSPEGFYTVSAGQLNPKSRWHRSFNLGFPNLYDRAMGRTGSYLMVHGGCSSIGCYAMTNKVISEIWSLVTASLKEGKQRARRAKSKAERRLNPRFPVHVFPFRMSKDNMEKYAGSPWGSFWQDLKKGYDAFETAKVPPVVTVCAKRYAISAPAHATAPIRKLTYNCLAS